MESSQRIIVFYHGSCPDGFGGAYAAWKKFGDTAEYIPLGRHHEPPMGVQGAQVYFVDFCYPKEIMDRYVAEASSVTVLDHHEGVADVITAMPEYRYTSDHSGAVIAWKYFHPDTPTPLLLQYIETGDLYRFNLPDADELLSYIYTRPYTFLEWQALDEQMEDPAGRVMIFEIGRHYAEHKALIVQQIMRQAELVQFEGYTCYLASCTRQFTSSVGDHLARKHPPLALVAVVEPWGIRVSMRSIDTVDVSAIARKYGGNGHPHAAAFSLLWKDEIPWQVLDSSNEDSSD